MKTFSKFALSVVFGACGLVGMQGSAYALTTEHGSICKPYNYSNAGGVYSSPSGIWNYTGGSTYLLCPVVRTVAAPSSGFQVWVDGRAGTGGTCYLSSYNYNGTFLGSVSRAVSGTFDILMTLPQSQVPTYSSQSVYCYLPNNGAIFDVEPVQ